MLALCAAGVTKSLFIAEPNKIWLAIPPALKCLRNGDYYKEKRVVELNKINENEYSSIVKGTNNYNVHLDIEHPRKSSCNCPLANGKRIICKHIVATYFTAFPNEAVSFEEEQNRFIVLQR